jgi:hypothetical protein
MGTGYTRADTLNNIADGNIINASDIDSEYDAIEAAFNETTGHTHDGTAAEGAPITVLGPVQDFIASATEIKPKTTNTLDIGTNSLQFKDMYLEGTAYLDDIQAVGAVDITGDLDVDNININGNTISSTDTNGNITLAPNGTGVVALSSTDLTFGDNDEAIFGAGSDLQIYHNGSASDIKETGTGNLRIWGDDIQFFNSAGSKYHAQMITDGAVTLYYNGAEKLATTATGVDVTGTVTASGNVTSKGGQLRINDGTTSLAGGMFTHKEITGAGTSNDTVIFAETGNKIRFATNGSVSDKVVIDTAGNVGIGVTPAFPLVVKTDTTTNVGMFDIVGAATVCALDNSNASAELRLAGLTLSFSGSGGSGSEHMRIDSSGNVLVGKTSQSVDTVGAEILPTGIGQFTVDGNFAGRFTRQTSDGDIVVFRKGTGTVGSIGTVSGGVSLGSGDTGLYFEPVSNEIRPFNTTTNASIDNAINLGNSTKRFKDLYLSGGVYLGGTGAANLLDDYEEGTLSLSSTTGTAFFGGITYTKVGNQVTVRFYVETFSDTSTASAISVTGLPYASSSTNQATGSVLGKFADTIGGDAYIAYVGVSSSTLLLFKTANNANYSQIQHSHLTSASAQFIVTLTYEAA